MTQGKRNVRLTTVAGICCSVLFLGLLGVRLGLFEENRSTPLPITRKTPATYTWLEIFQESEKIGYSHRRVLPKDDGYEISESTFMRLNTMGMVQDINLLTNGRLANDMSLSAFDFELKSNRFNFKASGKVRTNEIELDVNGQATTMPVQTPIYLTAGIFDAVSAADIKIGETRTFNIFDPASMSQRPIKVTFTGMDKLKVLGQDINARKLETDFMGAKHTAWVTLGGEIVQETGPLGITLKKSDASRAFKNIAEHTRDLTRLVSVDAGRKLENAVSIKKIVYKIEGLPPLPDLAGERQQLVDNRLAITREDLAIPAPPPQVWIRITFWPHRRLFNPNIPGSYPWPGTWWGKPQPPGTRWPASKIGSTPRSKSVPSFRFPMHWKHWKTKWATVTNTPFFSPPWPGHPAYRPSLKPGSSISTAASTIMPGMRSIWTDGLRWMLLWTSSPPM